MQLNITQFDYGWQLTFTAFSCSAGKKDDFYPRIQKVTLITTTITGRIRD
jgi:hypothetical protein